MSLLDLNKFISEYQVQISDSESFSKIIFHDYIINSKATVFDLKPGNYFWRVKVTRGRVRNKKWSNISKFAIKKALIEIKKPAMEEELWLAEDGNVFKRKVEFKWYSSDLIENYNLEIHGANKIFKIDRSQGKDSKYLNKTDGNYFEEVNLSPGEYRWKLHTKVGMDILKLEEQRFEVILLNRPEIVYPPLKFNYYFSKQKENRHSVEFKWSIGIAPNEYDLQISSDKYFKNLIFDEVVEVDHYLLENLVSGSYFWRVRTKFKKRPNPAWSNVSEIKVIDDLPPELLRPENEKQIVMKKYLAIQEFKWEKKINTKYYRLYISKTKTFRKKSIILNIRLKKSAYKYTFKRPGKYFWKVDSRLDNSLLINSGEVRSIEIKAPKLDRPRLINKTISHKIKKYKLKKNQAIGAIEEVFSIEWEPVEGAVKYILVMTLNNKQVFKEVILTTFYVWEKPVVGSYDWFVIGVDKFGFYGKKSKLGKLKVYE